MLTLSEYRKHLKVVARGLAQEGWSQTAIAKELGMAQRHVGRWLNGRQDKMSDGVGDRQNVLSDGARFLVVPGAIEDFAPPDGVRFPLIIADPPWNVSDPGHQRNRKARPNRPFTKDFGQWDRYADDEAYLEMTDGWLTRLYEVAADNAFLFFWCSYKYISAIRQQAVHIGWKDFTFWVWHKTNPMPLFGNNNFLQSIELALVMTKGEPRFRFARRGGRQPHNYIESSQVGGNERVKDVDGSAVNLAQKPLGLLSLWVQWTTKSGDWVLDAFAGTGSATIAALQAGRDVIAVEVDPASASYLEHRRIPRECPGARKLP